MAKLDPAILAHLEWLGFVRPTGLVVSAPALVKAGAILDMRDAEGQRVLRGALSPRAKDAAGADVVHDRAASEVDPDPRINDFRAFASAALGWSFSDRFYAGTGTVPIPSELEMALPDAGLTLRPDFAVREREPQSGASPWQLLVRVEDGDAKFDDPTRAGTGLELSAHSRMERLLRHTGVSAGLVVGPRSLRLVSAPRGESSGWIDFCLADMVQTAGRPIATALRMLLNEPRLLSLPAHQRLAALLSDSRKFQNEVSEKLSIQVLHALYELVRGMQAAHDASKGQLLRDVLREDPDEVYRALLTVILRLVFLLYAEERDMMPASGTFQRSYSLAGLFARLREDVALHPDTMDQRYGAWAQLLAVFRMVHDGADAPDVHLPPRHGVLFDPDRYRFLEGRAGGGARQTHERIDVPLVSDGHVYRALEKLFVLDGERISYRALDVEQIGSVYETMMGFRLETAPGRSIAIKAQKKHGAPTTVDLDALLATSGEARAKQIENVAARKLTDKVKKTLAQAANLADLHAALLPVVDFAATPDLVSAGALVLQPSEERRRSSSHYTPRALTQPIVKTTLDPILARPGSDGRPPRPDQILDLKVCDPAMGSGAFLVEVCRYLGDALIESWRVHGGRPPIPLDEDEIVFARRLVAQRCLYGVDRNPVAVDLAKLSLWLVTLAKDHALTFVDHALRHGDSLVGLSRQQIEVFHWDTKIVWESPFRARMREALGRVSALRRQIREADERVGDWELRDLWDEAQTELGRVRLFGDLAIAAYFEAEKPKERERVRAEYVKAIVAGTADTYRGWLEERRNAEPPLAPFHWEIEFPEVFERVEPGFDAFVGNPPFMGGVGISRDLGMRYFKYLTGAFPPAGHQCDLAGYFFRRAYDLLRVGGTFGLIATNTIAQGDTREGSLKTILAQSGQIFSATKRLKWPGLAAVVVSVVHIAKALSRGEVRLDGVSVPRVSAYLIAGGMDDSPSALLGNPLYTQGSAIAGQGFVFDDHDPKASSLDVMQEILRRNPSTGGRILPYIGGEELNQHPKLAHSRYVIYLSDLKTESELQSWPELLEIIQVKVRPERKLLGANPNNRPLKKRWWAYHAHRPEFYAAASALDRVLAINCGATPHMAFAFLPTGMVYSKTLAVFLLQSDAAFSALQSRPHEVWARFFGSSLEDRLRYTPSDCFETFPFPEGWETDPALEAVGRAYHEFRAALLIRNDEGLTQTYNRFHDRDHDGLGVAGRAPADVVRDIEQLRALHAAMDRAVLAAYGWTDIPTDCEFLLDYKIDEEEWGTKKKPWRYRWPDDVQAEVLARLLELNAQRARAEALAGPDSLLPRGTRGARAPKRPAGPAPDLFT